jgi:hypothetical protein
VKYNDNFNLPPEETLEKMRLAYKASALKTKVLKGDDNSSQAIKTSEASVKSMLNSYKKIENLKTLTLNKVALKNIAQLISKTKSNVQEVKILYKHLEINCNFINKSENQQKNFCNTLKDCIDTETKCISNLFTLTRVEKIEDKKLILDRIMQNRLDVLSKLSSLFGTCSYRSYKKTKNAK